jgi:hypothetical protein
MRREKGELMTDRLLPQREWERKKNVLIKRIKKLITEDSAKLAEGKRHLIHVLETDYKHYETAWKKKRKRGSK